MMADILEKRSRARKLFVGYIICTACFFAPSNAAEFGTLNKSVVLSESALDTKPLFVPGRQAPVIAPPEPEVVAVPEPVKVVELPKPEVKPEPRVPSIEDLAKWDLIGVVRSSEGDLAVFQDTTKEELHRMSIGESLDGWELTEVKARSAVFKNGTVSAKLKFASDRKPAPETAEE